MSKNSYCSIICQDKKKKPENNLLNPLVPEYLDKLWHSLTMKYYAAVKNELNLYIFIWKVGHDILFSEEG